jgi:hypothetical protein
MKGGGPGVAAEAAGIPIKEIEMMTADRSLQGA